MFALLNEIYYCDYCHYIIYTLYYRKLISVKVHVNFIEFNRDTPTLEIFCITYVNYFTYISYYAGIFCLNIYYIERGPCKKYKQALHRFDSGPGGEQFRGSSKIRGDG